MDPQKTPPSPVETTTKQPPGDPAAPDPVSVLRQQSVVDIKDVCSLTIDTAYVDLRKLFDEHSDDPVASPAASNERRKEILDYALQTRMRLTRVLMMVRYAILCKGISDKLLNAMIQAREKGIGFELGADALWFATTKGVENAALPKFELLPAARILGLGDEPLPSIMERVFAKRQMGKEDAGQTHRFSASEERQWQQARKMTSIAIHLAGFQKNIAKDVEPKSSLFAPKGVFFSGTLPGSEEKLWTAELMLRSTHVDNPETSFCILKVQMHVKASRSMDPYAEESELPAEMLMMIEQRMALSLTKAMDARRSNANQNLAKLTNKNIGSEESDLSFKFHVLLLALSQTLTWELSALMAYDTLRSQLNMLSANVAWKPYIRIEEPISSKDLETNPVSAVVPCKAVTVRYWKTRNIHIKSILSSQPQGNKAERRSLFEIIHDPALPLGSIIEVQYQQISAEDIIQQTIGAFSKTIFKLALQELEKDPDARLPWPNYDPQILEVSGSTLLRMPAIVPSSGLEFRISRKSPSLTVLGYGMAYALANRINFAEYGLWRGEKELVSRGTILQVKNLVGTAIDSVNKALSLEMAVRSMCMMDIGASNSLPVNTAAMAAVFQTRDKAPASQLQPPFAPLGDIAPHKLFTLAPPGTNWKGAVLDRMKGSLCSGAAFVATPSVVQRQIVESILHEDDPDYIPDPPKLASSGVGTVSVLTKRKSLSECVSAFRYESNAERNTSSATLAPKRVRLTYATTNDNLLFVQESAFPNQLGCVNRYGGDASAAIAWYIAIEAAERRLRRDSLLRAFTNASVATAVPWTSSSAGIINDHVVDALETGLSLQSAIRTSLKVKGEPMPMRTAELIVRPDDSWQVRFTLLPQVFDPTNEPERHPRIANATSTNITTGAGTNPVKMSNVWVPGITCTGSLITYTYPSTNAANVRCFFRDLTCTRTAAALSRSLLSESKFFKVLVRAPVRVVIGVGYPRGADMSKMSPPYEFTVEFSYTKSNHSGGGFNVSFIPSAPSLEMLGPLIDEALDASGGAIGGVLAGILEQSIPLAIAIERGLREKLGGKVRCVTALRMRFVFAGLNMVNTPKPAAPPTRGRGGASAAAASASVGMEKVAHALDIDAKSMSGYATIIDVGRATNMALAQAQASGASPTGYRNEFANLPRLDEIAASLTGEGASLPDRSSSQVKVKIEYLEEFFGLLVSRVRPAIAPVPAGPGR